jgi:hypothetical protein
MKQLQDELLAPALKELRRRRSTGSGPRIDYAPSMFANPLDAAPWRRESW